MSGHSKWATTKHQKAVKDARRGKLFAKLIRAIEVAARTGGSNLEGNPTLADAVAKARGNSLPLETIERAIKRGAGELGGVNYEAVSYEGYAPGGVAVLVECLTDNRNRAASEVRTTFSRNGGSMADPGSVAYLFARRGVVIVGFADGPGAPVAEDDVLAAVLDAGAEEVNDLGGAMEVLCDPAALQTVRAAVDAAGLPVASAEVAWLPSVLIPLEDETARRVLRLVDALEDLDDVQAVWANFDVSDDVLAGID